MKLMLDNCVWGGAVDELAQNGHDVIWVGNWNEDPGDFEILSRAQIQNRILITLDKDFGELAVVRQVPHCGIMRLANISAAQHGKVCNLILKLHGEKLTQGAIVTVNNNRIRIRMSEN